MLWLKRPPLLRALDLQHTISKFLLKGKLGLAPVVNPGRVLDLGTGTGIWAVEFGMSSRSSQPSLEYTPSPAFLVTFALPRLVLT